ncbi:MAG: FlgD immunoglobulin-like domain containing protein [bacterium]
MFWLRSRSLGSAALATLVSVGAAHAFTAPATRSLEFPLDYLKTAPVYQTAPILEVATPRSLSIGPTWQGQVSPRTGLIHAAWGTGFNLARSIKNPSDAADAARGVLDLAGDLLATRADNIELQDATAMPGKWAVHFRQVVNGLHVYTSDAWVLLSDNGTVIALGSDFFPEDRNVERNAVLSESQAIGAAAGALSTSPHTDRPITADLVYVPAPGAEKYELRLAYRVVFESDAPFGRWESFVDATTGAILGRRNFIDTVNVTGTSQGDLEDFGYCNGVATQGFKNQTINITGGSSAVTDASGNFNIPNGGTAPVTVTAQFLGPYVNVNRYTGLGADASFSGSATPGTPLVINWTDASSRADERDMFFHMNRVHDFMKAIDPTLTQIDYAMNTSVGRTDLYCPGNAWWDGSGVNLCEAGGGYANTGRIGNVVYHEYGHGVTQFTYTRHGSGEPGGDLHEGNSDVLANLVDRQPIIGLGFFQGNCVSGIRNSQNSLHYPADLTGEGHHDGQIIAGFVWDMWQSMLLAYPQAVADSLARRIWHFSRDLGRPQSQPDQVLWSFMVDDDDANLDNGTPHYNHLCLGATNHGFSCPAILTGVLISHTPLGTTTNTVSGYDVVATITSTAAAIDPSSLYVHFKRNGGAFTDVLMTATGNPNEYSGHIPAQNADSEMQYYISAADMAANTRTAPPTAPAALFAFDVAYVYDTLEAGSSGWVVGAAGDNATTGIWTRVIPIGGDGASPTTDATPDPGAYAFVTGQCSGSLCSGGCSLGCNDVDGGTTTLFSPIYDLTGATQAKIKYSRWYNNDTGADPNNDTWVVDVSNDGGTTWTNVESTMVSQHAWVDEGADLDALFGTLGQVRLRFKASDLNSGSVVEAGVDDLRVLAEFGATAVNEVVAASVPLKAELTQNQPNPFSAATRVDFAVPRQSNVSVVVYDVSGRAVRTLTQGSRDAGRYSISWDGLDAAGQHVAAGVYFYRMTAGGEMLTRKMTVLK